MNKNGRVAICGSMSQYNLENPEKGRIYDNICSYIQNYIVIHPFVGARLNGVILGKTLTIKGFLCYDHFSRWHQAHEVLNEWIEKV